MKTTIKLIGLAALMTSAVIASAAVPVAENGKAKATIVANGNEESAKELAKYLGKITGAEIPVAEKRDGVSGAIIDLQVAPVATLSNDDRGKQGYRLKTDGNVFSLVSPTKDGLFNAVHGFLNDHLKVRFYTPTVEVVPPNRNLTIPDLDETQKPSFAVRGYVYNPGYSRENWRKVRGGSLFAGYNVGASHSFYNVMPPAKYFKDHPDWYPMNAEGKRFQDGNMPLCGTNAELPKELAKRLVAIYDKQNPKDEYTKCFVSCAQGDGFTPCLCPECRKLVKAEGSESAPYILMLNRALEIAVKERPQLRVFTFAYFDTLFPPEKMEVHPHLFIHIVNSSIGHFMAGDNINGLEEAPGQEQYLRAMKAWAAKFKGQTDRMSMYEWDSPFVQNNLFLPWPNTVAHCEDIKTYYKLGCIYNINIEGGGTVARTELCHWVWMNLFWNAEQDQFALIDDFLNGYYGPKAAPYLREYLDYLEEVRKDTWYPATTVRWSGWGEYLVAKFFTPEVRVKMKAILDNALAAAAKDSDPEYLKRTEKSVNALIPQMFLTSEREKPFAFTKDPTTGEKWFIRGGNPDNVKFIEPIVAASGSLRFQAYNNDIVKGGYSQTYGDKVEELKSDKLEVAVAPHIRAAVVSVKYRGKELLANRDAEGIRSEIPASAAWYEKEKKADELSFLAKLQPHQWASEWGTLTFERNIALSGDTLKIEREFKQRKKCKMHLRANAAFGERFTLAMPDVEAGVVTVEAGAVKKAIPLAAYAHVGNGAINMVNVAKAAGSDVQDVNLMVPEAADKSGTAEVPVAGEGDLIVRFGRGDGIAVEIKTTCKGWKKVTIVPDAKKGHVVITLKGAPNAGIEKPETEKVELPEIAFRVKDVGEKVEGRRSEVEQRNTSDSIVKAKIRRTGENTAINELDGAEMVWIPAGKFQRGAKKGPWSPRDGRPVREIELDGFWMYKHPVTFGEYKKVMEAGGKKVNPVDFGKQYTDNQMVLLSWNESEEYAKLVGAALPTEAQWERAARGNHKDAVRYPWGDNWEPERVACHELLEKSDYLSTDTFEIGKFPKGVSDFGVEEMIGCSFEWVNDWYDAGYYQVSPAKNPQGPDHGRFKVLKGGDSNFSCDFAQIGFRMICPPDVRGWTKTQFRCVINVPKE